MSIHPEDLGISPLPAQAELAIVLAEISTAGALVRHLDVIGLEKVRRRLKSADVVRICALGNGAEIRAVTLDLVCRRLAELGRAPEVYYESDMLPTVPDECQSGQV